MVHWRREWQTTSAFLPWELHEQYEKETEGLSEKRVPVHSGCRAELDRNPGSLTAPRAVLPSHLLLRPSCCSEISEWARRGQPLTVPIPEGPCQGTEQSQCWGKTRLTGQLWKIKLRPALSGETPNHHLFWPTEQFLSDYFCPEESRAWRERGEVAKAHFF